MELNRHDPGHSTGAQCEIDGVTAAARTRTRTWPGPGCGTGTSDTVSTPGVPYSEKVIDVDNRNSSTKDERGSNPHTTIIRGV